MTSKVVVGIATGVVLGFVLGGMAPRRELASARRERDAFAVKLRNQARPNLLQALLPGFGALPGAHPRAPTSLPVSPSSSPGVSGSMPTSFPARPRPDALPEARGDVAIIGEAPSAVRSAPTASRPAAAAPSQPGLPAPTAERPPPREPTVRDERPSAVGMLQGFEQLVSLQRVRSAAARAELVQKVELSDAQVGRFDSAVTRMNDRLAGYGEEVLAQATSAEPPTPAQALGLGHDVSGILFEAQQELDGLVGEKGGEVDPSATEIWNYVDLGQWLPYVKQRLAAHPAGELPTGTADAGAAAAPLAPNK